MIIQNLIDHLQRVIPGSVLNTSREAPQTQTRGKGCLVLASAHICLVRFSFFLVASFHLSHAATRRITSAISF